MIASRLIWPLVSAFMPFVFSGSLSAANLGFQPIPGSAYGRENDADINTQPFLIPTGFQQRVVSSERDLNLYVGSDMLDMNTVNETGKHAGRYLYRTHEVRPGAVGDDRNARRVDGGSGGALSVIDLHTGMARELIGRTDWEALDGLVWTPWQTLLFAEEVVNARRADPAAPNAKSGMVYELKLKPDDPSRVDSVSVRPMLGTLSHEGIEVDTLGQVYVIDEVRNGSIYKFVPDRYGDLSSGQLYALKVISPSKTGDAVWVALDMLQVQVSARDAAQAKSATEYCRPEDIERIGETLYVALTCEDVDDPANTNGPGAILAVNLGSQPAARYVVAPGKNVPVEIKPGFGTSGVTGFKHPDNLASGPNGTLWIAEDNEWSDIWVYDPKSQDANGDGYRDGVHLFASLKDKPAEASGIYFGPDSSTLYVNVQHSGTGNDKTVAISRHEK
ncbi:MAG TPA: alkaline phosphatase PhoX [Thiobacillus sp.]